MVDEYEYQRLTGLISGLGSLPDVPTAPEPYSAASKSMKAMQLNASGLAKNG